ncbi:MAG: type II toxin-antitoxin system HicB family antitoxin [Lachnospiraceae bacterium]|nr:type II toxin-antitoxin system HicB family antitoxin [Lachnospiraceae bacterium]
MKYEFCVYRMTVEDHIFWVAESKALKGCVGQGETSQEAIEELEQNEKEWLSTAAEVEIPIPAPTARNTSIPSGKFALRLAPNVYSESCEIAEELGISINQYFNNAIVEYNTRSLAFLYKPVSNDAKDDGHVDLVPFPVISSKQPAGNSVSNEKKRM